MKIRDDYSDHITCTFSVYPSSKVIDVVVEPYNATLSLHQSLENSDEPFVVMYSKQPKYADLNWVMSSVISGIAASLRFSGKIDLNLTFPRLHFFAIAEALLFTPSEANKIQIIVQEITDQLCSANSFLANIKLENGKKLCASCLYRGNIAIQGSAVKAKEYNSRLLHITGYKRQVQVYQVPIKVESLNNSDCFISDAGLKVFQFNGTKSSAWENVKPMQ